MTPQVAEPSPMVVRTGRAVVFVAGLAVGALGVLLICVNIQGIIQLLLEKRWMELSLFLVLTVLVVALGGYLLLLAYRLMFQPTSEALRALAMLAAIFVWGMIHSTFVPMDDTTERANGSDLWGLLMFPALIPAAIFHCFAARFLMWWLNMPDARRVSQRIRSAQSFLGLAALMLLGSLTSAVMMTGERSNELMEGLDILLFFGGIAAALILYKIAVWYTTRRIRARYGRVVGEASAIDRPERGAVGASRTQPQPPE